jgi:hypothetical protein
MMRASFLAVLLFCASGPRQPLDDAVAALPGNNPAHASGPCGDGEYLRRLSLDLLGYPPNAPEAAAFIGDAAPDKRARKLDEFLATPRFADFWSRRYAEVFFGNYHEPAFDIGKALTIETRRRLLSDFIVWLRGQIQSDQPWPQILTELITARGRSDAVPQIAYKLSFQGSDRQEISFAVGVSRHLLGINLHCARCHEHPTEQWRIEDVYGLGAFNTRQRVSTSLEKGVEQIALSYEDNGEFIPEQRKYDAGIIPGERGGDAYPVFLSEVAPGAGDRTGTLVRLILKDDQKRWAKAFANRTWSWLLGRGVVEPLDEAGKKHPPVSVGLQDALVAAVEEGKGSLKALVRTICLTESYQRSSESALKCDARHFCRGAVLPLTGEQMLHSIQVALRGAPGLDVQEAQDLTAALTMRPQVGCEVHPLPCGTLHALMFRNSGKLWDWMRSSAVLAEIRKTSVSDDQVIEKMFLAALTRKPTATERLRYSVFLRDRGNLGVEDAYWTLMNTAEFLTRH